jgi:protein-disulfide isomerase
LQHARSLNTSRSASAGPPWIYGRADARFTLIEYADLECPYCREYFPVLRQWIDANPEVNWQWHHLPLSIHDPAATQAARLAECAGEAGGNTAFWSAVTWIYQHTRGAGAGLPATAKSSVLSPAVRACLGSTRPDHAIKAAVDDAAREQISATPTLRLVDHKTAKALTLQGSIDGDVLLSAMDLLTSPSSSGPSQVSGRGQ